MLGSGNLGLVYLMEEARRLTLEEIDARHPLLLPALRGHPHIGWLLVHSRAAGAGGLLGPRGVRYLAEDRVEGEDPLADFPPNAPQHLLRTDGFAHVADIMVGSFYDPALDSGCAFEELISFHGGLGGPQTRPFLLYPATLPPPDEQLVGAASVHRVLVVCAPAAEREPGISVHVVRTNYSPATPAVDPASSGSCSRSPGERIRTVTSGASSAARRSKRSAGSRRVAGSRLRPIRL